MKREYKTYRPMETMEKRLVFATAFAPEISNHDDLAQGVVATIHSSLISERQTDWSGKNISKNYGIIDVTSVIAESAKNVREISPGMHLSKVEENKSQGMVNWGKSSQIAMNANMSFCVDVVAYAPSTSCPVWKSNSTMDPEVQNSLDLSLS